MALAKVFIGSLGGGKSLTFNLVTYLSVLFGAKSIIIDPKSERGKWKEDLPEIADAIDVINITSDEQNRGMLDPFVLIKNQVSVEGTEMLNAESLALDILIFLTGVSIRDHERMPLLREAVKRVAKQEQAGMLKVIDELRKMKTKEALELANHIAVFTDYDFAKLLFSDGEVENTVQVKKRLTIIQIADLILPEQEKEDKKEKEEESAIELLSMAIMMAVSTFALSFAQTDRSTFKIFGLEEAWAMMGFTKGKLLVKKMVRMGRALNVASDFVTQNTDDMTDEKIKNNLGLRFAFRSTDPNEIEKVLTFFGIDPKDKENQKMLTLFENGQCLFRDLYGRVGVVQIDYVLPHLFKAFDTRPPQTNGERAENGETDDR